MWKKQTKTKTNGIASLIVMANVESGYIVDLSFVILINFTNRSVGFGKIVDKRIRDYDNFLYNLSNLVYHNLVDNVNFGNVLRCNRLTFLILILIRFFTGEVVATSIVEILSPDRFVPSF